MSGLPRGGAAAGWDCWTPRPLLHQLRKEWRQITDLSPALIPLDSRDAKVLKVLVEHCLAFLGEWWRTIVLFLPDHSAVGASLT